MTETKQTKERWTVAVPYHLKKSVKDLASAADCSIGEMIEKIMHDGMKKNGRITK